jgi:hypothetical protein
LQLTLPASVLGLFFFGIRKDYGGPVNFYDKTGLFVAGLFFLGAGYWISERIAHSSTQHEFGFVIFSFLLLLGVTLAIYGYFGFLGMFLPAPSRRHHRRPAPSGMPHSNRPAPGRDNGGGPVDPNAYGREHQPGSSHPPAAPPSPAHQPSGGSAPADAPQISYQPMEGYSTDQALHLFKESRVRGAPSNTKAARSLAGHCAAALGPKHFMAFLNQAARDDHLPKKTRQFYSHALQEMERG